MFKNLFSTKLFKQRGQVLVLYAVMIPLLFMFAGIGIDLGWYYLNVSRLQNAADAAAVAGAREFVNDNINFSAVRDCPLTSNRTFDSSKIYSGSTEETSTINNANSVAKKYAVKNLGNTKEVNTGTETEPNMETWLIDSWSKSSSDSNRRVEMNSALCKDDSTGFYFVVTLKEKIEHLFMPGWFDPMDAPVTAVAMLTDKNGNKLNDPKGAFDSTPDEDDPQGGGEQGGEEELPTVDPIPRDSGKGSEQQLPEGDDILTRTYNLEDITVMRNWEWQQNATDKQYESYMNRKKYSGKWNEYQDKTKDNKGKTKVVHYVEGNHYRTETVKVQPVSSDGTTTNGTDFDSLNLDFHPDVEYKFTEDWDIGYEMPAGLKQTYRSSYNGGYDLRIHSTFNFGDPYPVRSSAITEEDPEDALYVRVESEPIEQLSFKNQTFFSTVRQIFLNINKANTGVNDRPLVFFYDGPEQITANLEIRKSQPVILTLNADARVILFAPNSPVVIRGNGYKMQGFVIAKNFVQLTTEKDYNKVTEDGVTRYFDKKNPSTEYFYIEEEDTFVDSNGNVQTKPLSSNASREREGIEVPENTSKIQYPEYERVYKLETFNLNSTSYYDSFKIAELERHVYTYLDNYKDNGKTKSVDMFFTKIRSSWID